MSNSQKEYERIKKYSRNSEADQGAYGLKLCETLAIKDCSLDIYAAIATAFDLGFEKGCRATRKAAEYTA